MKTPWFLTWFLKWVKHKKPYVSGRSSLLFFCFCLRCCVRSKTMIYISQYNYLCIFEMCLVDFIIICVLFLCLFDCSFLICFFVRVLRTNSLFSNIPLFYSRIDDLLLLSYLFVPCLFLYSFSSHCTVFARFVIRFVFVAFVVSRSISV